MRIRGMRVGGANQFAEETKRRVREFVFLQDGIERHVLAVVTKCAAVDVKWRRLEFARLRRHLVTGHKDELSLRVNELLDESRTGNPVHLHFFTGNPLHGDTIGWAEPLPLLAATPVRVGAVAGATAASFLIRRRVNCTFDPA